MSKYLYFQDSHLSGKNSINRLGDYLVEWLTKFDELIDIAKKNDCEAILDGGDLLDGKNPSYSVLDALADRIEKNKMDIYSLLGNHAMESGHIENSQNTGLYHLQKRCKYFHYLERQKYLGNQFNKFDIQAIDYKFGIEEELKSKEIIFEDNESWKILILHCLVTPSKFFENTSYILPEQISTNADLILCSHYHTPFEKKIGNSTFLNIGAFGRTSISEHKIEPSVLLLNTEKRSYEIIKLKSAKKGEDIFNLTKYEELKENKKDIKEFIESLRDIDLQSMNIGQQIVKIGHEQKIDKNVIDYLLEKINEVKV